MKKNNAALLHKAGVGVKPLLVVAMMVITASFVTAQEENAGFSLAGGKFGQVNIKAGIDLESTIRGYYEDEMQGVSIVDNEVQNSDLGFTLTAEYLSPLLFNIFKGGIGVQYAFPRKSWAGDGPDYQTTFERPREAFSFLPVYAALQLHPVKSFQELFLRGNIGYVLCLSQDQKPEVSGVTKKPTEGGLYWGAAAGFEFSWGLIAECSYSYNYWKGVIEQTGQPDINLDFSYGKVGISLGYRLKL